MLDLLRRNASGPFGLTLIILLVLAFSVWGIGDIFRNYDVGTLARIGDREVDSQEFLFRYNREINRISNELERFVANEEARDSGIDIQILTNLLVEKTLNSSADKMKLRPSDNSLTERLKNTSSFRNAFNQFDKNSTVVNRNLTALWQDADLPNLTEYIQHLDGDEKEKWISRRNQLALLDSCLLYTSPSPRD